MSFEGCLEHAERTTSNPILLDLIGTTIAIAQNNDLISSWDLNWLDRKCPQIAAATKAALPSIANDPTMKMDPAIALLQLMSLQTSPGGVVGEVAYEIVRAGQHKAFEKKTE